MLSQEEFMDVQALKRQGLTITEIARQLGYHPATISAWLAAGGPPQRRRAQAPPLIDERWAARIAELLRRSPRLLATSVFEMIAAEGFSGSYQTVARHLHALRGQRFSAAAAAQRHRLRRGPPGAERRSRDSVIAQKPGRLPCTDPGLIFGRGHDVGEQHDSFVCSSSSSRTPSPPAAQPPRYAQHLPLNGVLSVTRSDISPYDCWQWQHRWKDYLPNADECLLVADALRRAVDLRDTLAGGPSEHQETTRALMLVDVLNAALEQALTKRSPTDGALFRAATRGT
jgi:transposase